MIKKDNDVLKW